MPVQAPSPSDLWVSADPSQHHLEVAPTQNNDLFGVRDNSALARPDGGERIIFTTIPQTEAALSQMKQLQRQQQRNGSGQYDR